MKPFHAILSVSVACLVLLLAVQGTMAAQTSYPMVCKGGGEMKAKFSHAKKGSFRAFSLAITFRKSPRVASGPELAPGHCSWVDRPISREEPNSLAYAPGTGTDFTFSFAKDRWSLVATESEELEQILNAVRRGTVFHVRCHRKQSWFQVDRVGP